MTGRSRHLVGRDARMAELANQGKTTREIADDLKVDIQLVGIWARLTGDQQ